MLRTLDRAILGGHFMNDSEINKYPKLVSELLDFYTPELLGDCYADYNELDKNILYSYAEQRSRTLESALEVISNETINSLGYGLKSESLDKINVALDEINEYYKPVLIPKTIEEIELNDKQPTVFSSGCDFIDNVIGINGFETKRSYIFASKAKGKKSIFLQNLALLLKNANPAASVLYLSLENNEHDILIRHKAMLPTVIPANFVSPHYLYSGKCTLEDISNLSKKYKILIVDYLARITPPKELEREENYKVFGELADRLHYIAEENDCVIITAAQLNRSSLQSFKKDTTNFEECFLEIDQDNLADSMGILRNSDSVSIIWPHDNKIYLHNIATRIITDKNASYIDFIKKTDGSFKLALSKKSGAFLDK